MLAIGLDKAKKPSKTDEVDGDDDAEVEAEEESELDGYAQDAWDAIQDGDEESFKLAFKGAVECASR